MTIFAIDPGPHTAFFWQQTKDTFERRTFDFTQPHLRASHRTLYEALDYFVNPKTDTVVCESFEFRKDDAKNREYIDYSTGEYVGVVKLWCQMRECFYVMQSASQAKGFWNDDKLIRIGLYVPGVEQRHARDATRHWLHYNVTGLKDETWLYKLR